MSKTAPGYLLGNRSARVYQTIGVPLQERRCHHTLSIASLVIAVAYLLLIVVGALGALLLLVWLFRDTPSGARTQREATKGARNVKLKEDVTATASAEIELPKDRAA